MARKNISDRITSILVLLKEHWVIVAIMLFALSIRLYRIDTNLPNLYWHDENNNVETALRFGTGNFRPHTFQHVMLLPLILLAEYALYFGIKLLLGIYHSPVDILSEYIINPINFYLISRFTVLLFGLACIILIYLISLKLYNKTVANMSSLLFSLALMPFIHSKWTKADMPATFFLLMAFLITISIFMYPEKNNRIGLRKYIIAGFFIGLAAAAKLYALFGFSFVFMAHLFNYERNKKLRSIPGFLKHMINVRIVASGVFLLIGFILGNPYLPIDPHFFYTSVSDMSNELTDKNTISWMLYFKEHIKDVVGSGLLAILILISCGFFLLKRSKKELLLLVYPVVLYLFYMRYSGFAHYLIPAVPFLLIVTAVFFNDIFTKKLHRGINLAITGVIFLAVFSCMLNILRYNMLIAKPDTRTLAQKWIETEFAKDSVILSEGYIATAAAHSPQIKGNLYSLKRDLVFIKSSGGSGLPITREIAYAERDMADKRFNIYKVSVMSADDVEKIRPELVVLSGYIDMDISQREYTKRPDFYKNRKALYDKLGKDYLLIKEFTPYPKFSFFFPIFLVGDLKKLESIDLLKSEQGLLQGPEIRLFRRR